MLFSILALLTAFNFQKIAIHPTLSSPLIPQTLIHTIRTSFRTSRIKSTNFCLDSRVSSDPCGHLITPKKIYSRLISTAAHPNGGNRIYMNHKTNFSQNKIDRFSWCHATSNNHENWRVTLFFFGCFKKTKTSFLMCKLKRWTLFHDVAKPFTECVITFLPFCHFSTSKYSFVGIVRPFFVHRITRKS